MTNSHLKINSKLGDYFVSCFSVEKPAIDDVKSVVLYLPLQFVVLDASSPASETSSITSEAPNFTGN